jgi:hypothetical protein
MHQFNNQSGDKPRSAERAGYAEWIALGAIAAGSVGAIVGMTTCGRERTRIMATEEPVTPESVTAPHGDPLKTAIR